MSAFKRKNYHSYNDYYFDKKKNHNYSHHLENHTKYKNDKKLENDSFLIHKDYTNSHNFTKEPIDIQFDNNRYFDYHTRNNGTNMDYQRNQDSTLNEKLDRSNTSIDRSFYEQKSDPYNSHRNYGYSTKNHDYHIDTNDRSKYPEKTDHKYYDLDHYKNGKLSDTKYRNSHLYGKHGNFSEKYAINKAPTHKFKPEKTKRVDHLNRQRNKVHKDYKGNAKNSVFKSANLLERPRREKNVEYYRKIDIPQAMSDESDPVTIPEKTSSVESQDYNNNTKNKTEFSEIDKPNDGGDKDDNIRESSEDMDEIYYEYDEPENKNTEEIIEANTTISNILDISKISMSECVECHGDISFILQQYCTVDVNSNGIPVANIDLTSVQKYIYICKKCKYPYHLGCAYKHFRIEGNSIFITCKNCKNSTLIDHKSV